MPARTHIIAPNPFLVQALYAPTLGGIFTEGVVELGEESRSNSVMEDLFPSVFKNGGKMYQIVTREDLTPEIHLFEISAPDVAKKAQAVPRHIFTMCLPGLI